MPSPFASAPREGYSPSLLFCPAVDWLLGEPLDQFLAFWQTKRDGRRRGVVEIFP
jgi:hypothetical protein